MPIYLLTSFPVSPCLDFYIPSFSADRESFVNRIRRDRGWKPGGWLDRSGAYRDGVHGYWIRQEILQERRRKTRWATTIPPPSSSLGGRSALSRFFSRDSSATPLIVSSIDFATSSTLDIVTIIRRKLT